MRRIWRQPHQPTRLTRREAIYALLGGTLMSTTAMTRLADDNVTVSAAQATQFIQQSGDRLIAILGGSGEPAVKRRQLEALISDAVDVDGIARFALGRLWHSASDEQRSEYVRLFPTLLLGNLRKAFGDYQGARFSIDRAAQADNSIQVSTTVYRPDYTLPQVIWHVGTVGGRAKIVDIVAGGVSMRIAQRNNCDSLLAHLNYSVQALIETMRQRSEALS